MKYNEMNAMQKDRYINDKIIKIIDMIAIDLLTNYYKNYNINYKEIKDVLIDKIFSYNIQIDQLQYHIEHTIYYIIHFM